jgi:predicted nucleic acid-binding protein
VFCPYAYALLNGPALKTADNGPPHKKTLDALTIQKAVDESRIKVKTVENRKLVTKLEEGFSMAIGESEAIALALQETALLVGIGDRQGINTCKLLGIPSNTAVAICCEAARKV